MQKLQRNSMLIVISKVCEIVLDVRLRDKVQIQLTGSQSGLRSTQYTARKTGKERKICLVLLDPKNLFMTYS